MTMSRVRMSDEHRQLRSVTRDSGRRSGAAAASAVARRGAIPLQLRLQLLQRGEALHVAQPLHPLHPHPLAVQVAVEVEQVRFEGPPAVAERGPGPWFIIPPARPPAPLHPDGVDPVGRQQLPRRDVGQVDRRDPDASGPALPRAPPAPLSA